MTLYDVIDSIERKQMMYKNFKVNATTIPIFLFFFFVMQANENLKKEKLKDFKFFDIFFSLKK